MALLERKGDGAAILVDRFERVADEAELPESGGVLVSLARFTAEKDALVSRDGGLGVWLQSSESPTAIAEDLDRIALIALDFPVFSDGRAYSSARLLRERYGYKGELRAMMDTFNKSAATAEANLSRIREIAEAAGTQRSLDAGNTPRAGDTQSARAALAPLVEEARKLAADLDLLIARGDVLRDDLAAAPGPGVGKPAKGRARQPKRPAPGKVIDSGLLDALRSVR